MQLDIDLTTFMSAQLSGKPVEQNKLAEDYTTTPAVVFFRSDSTEDLLLNGDAGLTTTNYDVEIYGSDIDAVESAADTLKTALHGKIGAMGDSTILGAFVSDHASDYVPKADLATDEGLNSSTFSLQIIQ